MPHFPGVYVATITPFDDDDRVDVERLRAHVSWMIERGVHGIVAAGSCAEYAALDEAERRLVVETVADVCIGRVPVVVGTGASCTRSAVHWAEHAQRCGAAALMALPPGGYRPSDREIRSWYQALGAVGLPIIAYNNPFDTAVDLTPERLVALQDVERLVAVKEYSGDVRRIPILLETTRFEVIVGCDDLAMEGLLAGATGWIAGLSNVLAGESVALYDLVRTERIDEARALYARLLPLFRYDSRPTFVQAIKFALDRAGKNGGATRPPRLPLPGTDCSSIAKALEAFTSVAGS